MAKPPTSVSFLAADRYSNVPLTIYVSGGTSIEKLNPFSINPFVIQADSCTFARGKFQSDNQKHQHRMKKEQQTLYVSPQVKTVEIKAQAIICQSGGIDDMTIDPDGGESFS